MTGTAGFCLARLGGFPAQRPVWDAVPGGNFRNETGFPRSFGAQAMVHRQGAHIPPARLRPVGRDQQEGKRIPSPGNRDTHRPGDNLAKPVKRIRQPFRNCGGF